jgi:hypothetical protein
MANNLGQNISTMNRESMLDKIVGTWKLVSIYFLFDDGTHKDMYGDSPIGILMYDNSGYMNAQLGSNHRQDTFKDPNAMVDPLLKSRIFDSYMAYYGTYYEEVPGKVIHVVEGCTNPTWIGEKEIRFVDVKGDTLKIWTPKTVYDGKKAVIEVIWQRAQG